MSTTATATATDDDDATAGGAVVAAAASVTAAWKGPFRQSDSILISCFCEVLGIIFGTFFSVS